MFEQVLQLLESRQKRAAHLECRKIVRLHNDKPDVLQFCANIAIQCNRHEEAIQWLQEAIRQHNNKASYHYDLATAFMETCDLNAAISSLEKALKINSDDHETLSKLGQLYCDSGSYRKAIHLFLQTIKRAPDQAGPYYWLGIAYIKMGFSQKALNCFTKAVSLEPNHAPAHCQLGLICMNSGHLMQSRDCFYKAVQINSDNWWALSNLCLVLRDLGELHEAKNAGHRAASLMPDAFEIWHNLGNVYKDLGDFQKAVEFYEKAIQLNSASVVSYVGMGIACKRIGDTPKALRTLQRALSLEPNEGTALSNLLEITMMDCDWELADHYNKLIHDSTEKALREGQVPSEAPFLNIIRCDNPDLNLAVAKAWSQEIENKVSEIKQNLRFTYLQDRNSKIRVGYLSNNFGNHPTAHITRRLYALHDRNRFEVFCFSYGDKDNSRYYKDIRDGCDAFIDIRNLSNVQAAKRINEAGVDILIDLVGFMKGERLSIVALRPAPIQVRWLGMAGTSGSTFFDYIISDRIVTPPDQASCYTENFVYLPHCYQINDNQPLIENMELDRSACRLPKAAFVFCSFNTSYKIDAPLFAVWMKILDLTPGSVLWIMAGSKRMQDNLKRAATEMDVDSSRLIFADKIPKQQHLTRLPLADLVLDTIKVNGAASISDALWAGVPVLTFQGKHFASRMSSSILKAAGLERLVASSIESYQKKAINLANEKTELQKIRKELARKAKTSHLFNTKQTVSHLEDAYERMWLKYVDGKIPTNIQIQ